MMEKPLNKKHVCPWWLCFTFDNPLRKLVHDPIKILSPYVREGDTVIDIGPGMGYFTVPLATLVGPAGSVIAVDIQERMLARLSARAQKHGVSARIRTHLAESGSLGLLDQADFILAFWMAHEVADARKFFSEIRDVLKPEGLFLLVEPRIHVSAKSFSRTVETAIERGCVIREYPEIRMSRSALFALSKKSNP